MVGARLSAPIHDGADNSSNDETRRTKPTEKIQGENPAAQQEGVLVDGDTQMWALEEFHGFRKRRRSVEWLVSWVNFPDKTWVLHKDLNSLAKEEATEFRRHKTAAVKRKKKENVDIQAMSIISESPYEPYQSAEVGESPFDRFKNLLLWEEEKEGQIVEIVGAPTLTVPEEANKIFGEHRATDFAKAYNVIRKSESLFNPLWLKDKHGMIGGVLLAWIPKALMLLLLHEKRFSSSTERDLTSLIQSIGVLPIFFDALRGWKLEDPRLVCSAPSLSFSSKKKQCLKCILFIARVYRCIKVLHITSCDAEEDERDFEERHPGLYAKVKECVDILKENVEVNKNHLEEHKKMLLKDKNAAVSAAKGAKKKRKRTSNDDESDEDSYEDQDSFKDVEEPGQPRPYTYGGFIRIWRICEAIFGETTESIEKSSQIRSANQAMCQKDTDGQAKAQYGRLLPRAVKKLFTEVLELTLDDVYLDIGHGIGNTCLQAASTIGCEARGIEVVESRHLIALDFRHVIFALHESQSNRRIMGKVDLRYGRLEDPAHNKFLTKGVTKAFMNNYGGNFSVLSALPNTKWFLDDYCAAIFASMAPGSILVTLDPLSLGPTTMEANANRLSRGLTESPLASFFSLEKVPLGKACEKFSWIQGNTKEISVHKYTRVSQGSETNDAVFLCCNPSCKLARNNFPIPATAINNEGRCMLNRYCTECNHSQKVLRRRSK